VENAAVEQCPNGICLELLVLPAAERGENQEFAAQLPHSPRSEAEGGTMSSAAWPLERLVGRSLSYPLSFDKLVKLATSPIFLFSVFSVPKGSPFRVPGSPLAERWHPALTAQRRVPRGERTGKLRGRLYTYPGTDTITIATVSFTRLFGSYQFSSHTTRILPFSVISNVLIFLLSSLK
jgi:hypothetical protein